MNLAQQAFCRVFQTAFHLALPILPYREPKKYQIIAACYRQGASFQRKYKGTGRNVRGQPHPLCSV